MASGRLVNGGLDDLGDIKVSRRVYVAWLFEAVAGSDLVWSDKCFKTGFLFSRKVI